MSKVLMNDRKFEMMLGLSDTASETMRSLYLPLWIVLALSITAIQIYLGKISVFFYLYFGVSLQPLASAFGYIMLQKAKLLSTPRWYIKLITYIPQPLLFFLVLFISILTGPAQFLGVPFGAVVSCFIHIFIQASFRYEEQPKEWIRTMQLCYYLMNLIGFIMVIGPATYTIVTGRDIEPFIRKTLIQFK